MKKIKKYIRVPIVVIILLTIFVTTAFASDNMNEPGTEIETTIIASENTMARADNAYAVCKAITDIVDDNHIFNKDVEVWAKSRTYLQNWISSTANGIPDWTLTAYCDLWVYHKDSYTQRVSSPSAFVYDDVNIEAVTKKVHTKDGGSAEAVGTHSVKNVYGEVVWREETRATEKF